MLIFLLLWSSCQTMSYYLVTKNHRMARNIQKHYAETEARIMGIGVYHFTFPDGEKILVTYSSEEKKKPVLFFSYNAANNMVSDLIKRNTYLKSKDLSFAIDSVLIGSVFNIVYSSIDPDIIMEEGRYKLSLSEEHVKRIQKGLKSFALVWIIILSVLWLILWVIYKINNDQLVHIPEKDIRTFKVRYGLAQEPNNWDDDL